MPFTRRQLSSSEAATMLAGLTLRREPGESIEDVSFPPRIKWQPRNVEKRVLRRVAFEGPVITGGLFRRGSIHGCVFDRVDFGGLRIRRVDFRGCRFEQCVFGGRSLGLVEDSSFVDCAIMGGRIDHVTFLRSSFKASVMEGVNSATLRWDGCTLEHVTVTGTLDGTTFVRSALEHVDFSAAELRDSAILDGIGGDVRLPDRPDNFTVSPAAFGRAESVLVQRLDDEAFDSFKRFAKSYVQLGPSIIISGELFPELGQRERRLVLTTLYELRKSQEKSP